LVESSHFHESHHFGTRNINGFKICELGIHPLVLPIFRVFLGLVGYYQKVIEGFSKTTKPMTELLGKDKKFNGTPTHEVWN
jgi:hypothetical protein